MFIWIVLILDPPSGTPIHPPPSACPGLRVPPQSPAMPQMLETEEHTLHTGVYSHVFLYLFDPGSPMRDPTPPSASHFSRLQGAPAVSGNGADAKD